MQLRKKLQLAAAAGLFVLSLLLVPAGGARAGFLYLAQMDGSQQVPPVPTPATGSVVMYLAADQLTGHITVKAQNLTSPIVAAHIHYGPGGENGPQIFNLGPFTDSTTVDFGPISSNILMQILAGVTYVNVHTVNYLAGEIRGQLIPQPSVSIIAYMNNTQEVPPSASHATGLGDFTLWPDQSKLHLDLSVQNFTNRITGSNIDLAPAGQNGPLVIDLGAFSNRLLVDLAPSSGQVQDLTAGADYLNVDSNVYPNGEIRGQIETAAPASVGPSSKGQASLANHLNASPNPLHQGTTLSWSWPAGDAAGHLSGVIRILDANGRSVRVMQVSGQAGKDAQLFWDGRDDQGHAVAGGLYFARLEGTSAPAAHNVRSLVVLR